MDSLETTQAPESVEPQRPPGGGSYQANPDGSLERLQGTEPAEPTLGPLPQPRD